MAKAWSTMLSMHLLLGEYFIFKMSLDELVVHFVTERTFLDVFSFFCSCFFSWTSYITRASGSFWSAKRSWAVMMMHTIMHLIDEYPEDSKWVNGRHQMPWLKAVQWTKQT